MGKVIRDAVHGDIELTGEELAVLDTASVQRLRGIKQLGTAYLVYPSARHTRFEHALGTLHLTGRLLEATVAHGGPALSGEQVRAARLAGLLHDVTHIPFGHTFEDERRIFDRHDTKERTLRFLRAGELCDVLERSGVQALVEEALVDDLEVRSSQAPRALKEVVRGTVGSDLLDYLRRDAYFCGLRADYDDRLFKLFRVVPGEGGDLRLALSCHKRGLRRQDALTEILHLLRLRYTLCERVYYHHAKVASGAMISRAVEFAVNEGLELEDLFPLGDQGLLWLLKSRFGEHARVQRLVRAFERRQLYRRAYLLTTTIGEEAQASLVAAFHNDRAQREEAERSLAATIGVAEEDVIIYCPEPRMAGKEADVPVLVDEGAEPVSLGSLGLPEVSVLTTKHRELWRFYVLLHPEHRDRRVALAAAAAERFGQPSVF